MKSIVLALAMCMTFAMNAQEKSKKESLNLEQRVELQVKKMTLHLDLNENQQKEIKKLLTEKNKKWEAGKDKRIKAKKDLTANEKFEIKNKRLDEKIAYKAEMKKVLTPAQFEKWENSKKQEGRKLINKDKKFKTKEK